MDAAQKRAMYDSANDFQIVTERPPNPLIEIRAEFIYDMLYIFSSKSMQQNNYM